MKFSTIKRHYQINQYISYPELRVIDQEGKQIGVMATATAVSQAQGLGLDLVVITDNAKPPIAKIIDFQKFKYQEAKKIRSGTTKSKTTETKEVRFTPFMAANDFNTRLERSREFLADGHRVKLVVKFIGRQMSRKEFGEKLLEQAITGLSEVSSLEQPAKWQGKLLIAQIKPRSQKKTHEQS